MRRIRHITHPCRVKKLTLILLCSLLLPYSLHAWNYPTSKPSGAYSGGNGSASNPYQISTAQDLADLAYMVSENGEEYSGKYFVMTKDITLNEGLINDNCTGRNEGNFQIWRPIGKYGFFSDNDFSGNFNGNGHTIYGLYITVDAKDAYNGLFGSLDVAMVRNLTIADSYIVAGTPNYQLNMYGFFAGRTDKTTLLNCHVKNSCIKNTDSSSLLQVGGLIGRGWGEKNELHRCSFEGNIILESYTECSPMEVSGMVGGDNAKLYNCSTKGKITLGGYPSALLYGMAPVIIDAYGCVSAMDFEIKTNGEYYNGTFAEYRFLEVSSLGGIVQKATLCATYGDIKIGTKDDPIKVCTKNKEALNDRVVKIGTFSSSTLETEIVQCAAYTNVELYIDDECADNAYVTTFGRTYAQCKPEKITYCLVAGKHIIPANTPYSPVLIYDEGAQWGPGTWETAYEWVKTTLYCNTVNGVTDTDRLIDPTANTTSDKNKYKQIGTAYLTGQALLNELNALNTGSNQWGRMTTEDRNGYPLPIFCGGSISALSLKGSGTVEAPFLIGSEADLRKFQEAVETEESQGKYYQLTADIDMSEESMPAIGSSSHPFQGTFDGNGHSINGLVTASGYLFDRLQGTVQNLTLLDYKGKADKTGIVSSIAYYVGSNADGAQAGHIQNCYVSGTIEAYRSGTVAENDVIATGLCVNVYGLSTIENSYFKGNIKVSSKTIDGQTVKNTGLPESDANTYLYVGGMAKAYSGITSTVATNSYASFNYECAADASFTSSQVNGLFAETMADSYLSNCYFVCSGIGESSTKKLSSESELNGKLDGCTGWKTGYYRPVVVGTKYYTVTKPDESRTETYLDAIPEDNPTPNYIMNFTPADEAQANDPYLWQLPNMAIYRDKTTTEVVIELDENGEPKKDESGEIISHTITHEDKADYLMGAVLDPNTDFSYKRSANATRTKGTLTYKLDAQESAYWRTLCLPGPIYSDLLPEGCKLYLGGALSSGNTMNIIKVDTIPAGTPCLIYVPAETSVPIYMLGDIKESPVLAADNSALQGTFQHTIGSNWCSTVSVASDNTKTLNTGTSVSLSPFSAYVGSSSDIILMDYLLLDELDPELAELIQGSISGTTDVYVRRTLNKAGWNTLCLPFDMTAEEIETTFGNGTAVEELKEVKTDAGQYTLVFKTVTGIEAGHPYLIKPTNSGNLYTLTERTLSTATTDISKETTDGTTFTMKASLGMAYLIGGMETDTDYYFTQGGNTLYRVADGQSITFRGFRSWFEIKEPSGTAAPLNIFKLQHDDGTTTDLQLVDKAQTPATDSQAYDLTGRPVTVRGKGIYVIGNKVRIVK